MIKLLRFFVLILPIKHDDIVYASILIDLKMTILELTDCEQGLFLLLSHRIKT